MSVISLGVAALFGVFSSSTLIISKGGYNDYFVECNANTFIGDLDSAKINCSYGDAHSDERTGIVVEYKFSPYLYREYDENSYLKPEWSKGEFATGHSKEILKSIMQILTAQEIDESQLRVSNCKTVGSNVNWKIIDTTSSGIRFMRYDNNENSIALRTVFRSPIDSYKLTGTTDARSIDTYYKRYQYNDRQLIKISYIRTCEGYTITPESEYLVDIIPETLASFISNLLPPLKSAHKKKRK